MIRLTLLMICLAVVFSIVLNSSSAPAHAEPFARAVEEQAGPYLIEIGMSADPARAEQATEVTVWAAPGGPSLDGAAVTMRGLPGLGTDATATRTIALKPEEGQPGNYTGDISMAVRGAWDLEIAVDGPAGSGTTRVPITVAALTAIPIWLGWFIGLSPLLGLIWFAYWNVGYLRSLRREESELN